jgi:acetyl-CoA carboxylase carboxyl transferase subunit alpha
MLKQMDAMSPDELRQARRQKYLDLGARGLAA